jgi:hypothetical protein
VLGRTLPASPVGDRRVAFNSFLRRDAKAEAFDSIAGIATEQSANSCYLLSLPFDASLAQTKDTSQHFSTVRTRLEDLTGQVRQYSIYVSIDVHLTYFRVSIL